MKPIWQFCYRLLLLVLEIHRKPSNMWWNSIWFIWKTIHRMLSFAWYFLYKKEIRRNRTNPTSYHKSICHFRKTFNFTQYRGILCCHMSLDLTQLRSQRVIMFLILTPRNVKSSTEPQVRKLPYCDLSSTWEFTSDL